ncbi:MAG: tRNA lysidine(34) synthetase TilS [Pseudomonadales bacterium]|nr:tRNA lysidine(34) synthetase TilS [Pseudomonadales bacterium]
MIDAETTQPDPQLIAGALATVAAPRRIYVGFSGGLDSTVLLHLLRAWWQQQPAAQRPPVHAMHVNHQLHPLAPEWLQHCKRQCAAWGVHFHAATVAVDAAGASLEQAARQARYQAFAEQVTADDVLLLAHHRDDQVETLLQRLARGSGPLGLGAMAMHSRHLGFSILRPLLALDRQRLQAYANHHGLTWVEDPSNQDETLQRNFLRQRLLPLWRRQHPGLNRTLARSARLGAEAAGLLEQLAAMDLGPWPRDGGLPLTRLRPLAPDRQRNLLRHWLRQLGAQAPSEDRLQRLVTEVMAAAGDRQPRVQWGRQSVRRFNGRLYLVPEPLPIAPGSALACRLQDLAAAPQSLALPLGRLRPRGDTRFSRQALTKGELSIDFRRGGERLALPGRPPKALKDLFQEQRIPPWWRPLWPILKCGDAIAGVPGLWVAADYLPATDADALALSWQPPAWPRD